jgi:hypothetical protein
MGTQRSIRAWETILMSVIHEYIGSLLVPQLRSLGLDKRQREIVAGDVTERLESLLSHWGDLPFRRTILVLGTEEASFWEPQSASLDVRSLVVVAVRNSLIEDLGTTNPYTRVLRFLNEPLPNEQMPWITGEAIKYFEAVDLDRVQVQPSQDLFGGLPQRFPNAWHALSLLGNSTDQEIACELPMAEAEPMGFAVSRPIVQQVIVVASGMDPRLDSHLVNSLKMIERKELGLFFSPAFKSITRNPEKLLSIVDFVLRHGAILLTPNYLLSPTYLARRNPLIRPIHYTSDMKTQATNPQGLCEEHRAILAVLFP